VYFKESPQGPTAETRPQADNAKQQQHQNQQQGHNANDANSHQPQPGDAPAGFNGVLTRKQWKGVIDFAHAVNGEIVTSLATSVGTRDAAGFWTPEQARQLLAYTKAAGGGIAAAEFMNEPTFATIGGAPKGYDAEAFARDIAVFRPF